MSRLSALFALLVAVPAVAAPLQVRVATFNASLNRNSAGQLATDLSVTTNNQAKRVAEIIQRVRPDILLLNEFDYDASNPTLALTRFHDNYLAVSQNGQAALSYPYRYIAPSNTGISSGFDLDNDGIVGGAVGSQNYADDCFGFGIFDGQYSFAVYSKYPIQTSAIRSFQLFKWKDMPGAVLPDNTSTPTVNDWYSPAELNVFRLSSKNHVDLPIEVKPGHVLHLLASHPTPPVFELGTGPGSGFAADYNGHRNHDEIRLWADYISGASYLRDDAGVTGGLTSEQRFIILGDMNADPLDGDSYLSAVNQLWNHPLINATANPASAGGTQQAAAQGGVNTGHTGLPAYDTSDFFDGGGGAGNLRVDHVFPSKLGLGVTGSGVFWPASTDPLYPLLFLSASFTQGNQTTDHRLVYLDLVVTPILRFAVRDLVATRQGGGVVLTWGTQPGVSYRVQTSPDFVAWNDAPGFGVTLDAGAQTATATDSSTGSATEKFYRVVCTIEAP